MGAVLSATAKLTGVEQAGRGGVRFADSADAAAKIKRR
jgi:hypothetical protein